MKPKCCEGRKMMKDVSETADFLKVLAEVNRLKIICMLNGGELCVCDIWQSLGISQNLVSHHLKVLKDAGLINVKRDGLKMIYSIDNKVMKKHVSLLQKFIK